MVGCRNGLPIERGVSSMFSVAENQFWEWVDTFPELKVVLSAVEQSRFISWWSSDAQWCTIQTYSGKWGKWVYQSSHFPLPFLHLQVHPRWTSPCSHKASLFLHSSILISFGRDTRCGWQMISEKGFGNCPFCSVTVLLADGRSECWECSGPAHTPSACEWWTLPGFFLLSISKLKKESLGSFHLF